MGLASVALGPPISDEQLGRLTEGQIALLAKLAGERKFNKFDFWQPFAKQWDFIALGMTCAERCLFAGNQVGKSETGAFETTAHLTGLYPPNWPGKRFDHPIDAWACGVSGEVVRDVIQEKLLGKPGVVEAQGTGMIPKHLLVNKPTLARGSEAGLVDTIAVRHVSGGVSMLSLKQYAQGREKFQGPPKHFIWYDEEPPLDIYEEGQARLTSTRGISLLTFTPLLALSDVVRRFTKDQGIGLDWHGSVVDGRGSVRMDFLDNPNYTVEDYERKKREYSPHQWDARLHGLPVLGAGRVWPFPVEDFSVPPFEIPPYWFKLWGCDFGINERHPFAGVLLAHDRETDVVYVVRGFAMPDALPWMHAERFRALGGGIPISWPHDGHARQKAGAGDELVVTYRRDLKLPMLAQHAQWPEGGYETERAVNELSNRISTGRFKVFTTMRAWFEEYLQYHRDEKTFQLVKVRDDLLSATFKGLMDLRHARPGAIGPTAAPSTRYGRDVGARRRRIGNFNLFTGERE
jgi:phage terminase large subunit-like protein